MNEEIYKKVLGLIDLTSLNSTDTFSNIELLTEKVNRFNDNFPDYPLPASICVFPNFAKTVASKRENKDVHITVVAGGFPTSQTVLGIKVMECAKAVKDGADEVDVVLALNSFLDGRFDDCTEEIKEMKQAVNAVNKEAKLKVILETGALLSTDNIIKASFLAMDAGADFIKTSTGKMNPAATPEAAEVMCRCIKDFYEETGKKVGFKPAGGISTPEDALIYYQIVKEILGNSWLDKSLFRFGASRMANNILTELEGKEVKYY